MKKSIACIAGLLVAAAGIYASGKDRDKDAEKKPVNQIVDSGSFGIFFQGKRIGTETFKIEQAGQVGTVTADLKVTDGDTHAEQSSEMQVSGDGSLKIYKWHANLPAKEEAIVEPKDQILIEHLTPADQHKQDVTHILPISTVILDDNFFSHRELLVWRYLATGCVPKQDQTLACNPSQFGVFIPHQHVSGTVTVALLGRDHLTYKGAERELNKLRVDADGVQWLLWVEDPTDHYKVVKLAVPSTGVEVVRD